MPIDYNSCNYLSPDNEVNRNMLIYGQIFEMVKNCIYVTKL